tara:strand:- start:12 stop:224 length:213 start_codon:yes stop_codon:yes gene_type:complete
MDIEDVKAITRAVDNYGKAIAKRDKEREIDMGEYGLEGEALDEYLVQSKLEASAKKFLEIVGESWMKSHL